MAARDVKRIDSEGTAWIDNGQGGEEPFKLVMSRGGVAGFRKLDRMQALGLDQLSEMPPLPKESRGRPSKKTDDPFDISGLDQSS